MISFGIALTLAIGAGIGIIALFAWLWKKMKKKPVAGGTIGFFIGIVVVTGMIVVPSNVYVINGEKDFSHYLVYSSSKQYEKSNGEKVDISIKQTQCMLINDTENNYVIESVVYGFGFADDILVEPQSSMILDRSKIDYFFDEEPPESIESDASGYVTRKWLRTEKDYGSIDGLDSGGFDNLRNLLEDAIEDN